MSNEVNFCELMLLERLVGYLADYKNDRNVLSFSESFKEDEGPSAYS